MSAPRLGLRENAWPFFLLVVVNACVGGVIGLERTLLPAIAEAEFQLSARTAILSFIVVFGISKAVTNYWAGRWSDRWGRKPILLAGWVVALPVPWLLIWAPSWGWILFANLFLGISQGLTWSTTVIMKVDLVGPQNRGLAMGLNEFAGYGAVAASAWATGILADAYGLRPHPFYLGALLVAAGLLLSLFLVSETRGHVQVESQAQPTAPLSPKEIFWQTSWRNKNLFGITQAGLVNNLNDGMAWGLFPLLFATAQLSFQQIGALQAIYPATWGIFQIFTGAWSDKVGRKWMISGGMVLQAVGILVVLLARQIPGFVVGASLLGLGTAMVYPVLLAGIGDVAAPSWRASAVGVYRLWRDLGYAVGAIMSGLVADLLGLPAALASVAALTFFSGVWVAIRTTETLKVVNDPGPGR